MILEIGPRGASCPRDRASYQRRRRSRGVIVGVCFGSYTVEIIF